MQRMKLDENLNGAFFALSISARLDRDDVQRTDRDGTPQWMAEVLRRPSDGSDAEVIKVRVSASSEPQLKTMEPVRLAGFEGFFWSMEGGRSGISLSADEIVPVASAGHSARSSEAKGE